MPYPPALPATLQLSCGPVRAIDLALFAAASGDHNPLHLDDTVARAAGFERPVVHGMLTMAYVARLFTGQWGPGALQQLHTRFTGAALRGDTIHLRADLTRTEGDLGHYTLVATNSCGEALVQGTAQVRLGTAKATP